MSIKRDGGRGGPTIFSDGGCIGNPGPGGWGAIVVREGAYEELGGADPATTNNRMEMTAAIKGLEHTRPGEMVRVVTDSRYVVDGASKWIWGWKKRGWVKSDGGPVLNRDLWERIDALSAERKVAWEHVRGHSGHPENERCDEIANSFARGETPLLKTGDGSWIASCAKPPARPGGAKTGKTASPAGGEKYSSPLYLSVVDGDVREHGSWTECEARIKGVKGSRCRKVLSREEHIAALAEWTDLC